MPIYLTRAGRTLVLALDWALPAGGAGTVEGDTGKADQPATEETGRPICVRVGTRSEGWAWPSGRFIHWAKCKGAVPRCYRAGPGRDVEGWYAGRTLIAPDHCAGRETRPK